MSRSCVFTKLGEGCENCRKIFRLEILTTDTGVIQFDQFYANQTDIVVFFKKYSANQRMNSELNDQLLRQFVNLKSLKR